MDSATHTLAEGRAPNYRELVNLAWPVVVSRSTQVVVGLTDALMVAGLGEDALAATTTGALNTVMLLILPMGIVFIVSSFASQLTGRNDPAGARRYGFYGLAVALFTQALGVCALPAVAWILELLPYTDNVRILMTEYMVYRLLGAGAAIGMEALGNYYGGLGNTRLPMFINVIAMVLNVFGNWVLIFGNLGAPALGVRGAALSSTLSTVIAFMVLLGIFLWEGRRTGAMWPSNLQGSELWRMLRFGIPAGFNWFFEFAAYNVFVNVVVGGLGTTSLAALMAVMQLNSVSFMPAFGLASAGAIFVGQSIGAAALDEVPKTIRRTLLLACIWQGAASVLYLVAPDLLFAPFVDPRVSTPELMQTGVRMLMLSAAWQLFDATANTLSEALRAAGDTTFALWARAVIAWLIFAPGAYISVRYFGWGDVGAVAWIVFYLALLAAALAWRLRTGAWRNIDLTGSLHQAAEQAGTQAPVASAVAAP